MGWQHKKGKEVLGGIQEISGDIHSTNGERGQVKIKRIEAWEAERILGIRCSLDGQDKVEFDYRLEEAQTLVGRMAAAPLTRSSSL